MSKHTTYRGTTIDMDSMRRENEKTTALGNMGVNAKGDRIGSGATITKTADQIARENYRVQTSIISTGLKGAVPTSSVQLEQPKPTTPVKTVKKAKEVELPSGDIVMENDNDNDA